VERHKNIFRSFRHVTHYIVRWANNETATIKISQPLIKINGDTFYID